LNISVVQNLQGVGQNLRNHPKVGLRFAAVFDIVFLSVDMQRPVWSFNEK